MIRQITRITSVLLTLVVLLGSCKQDLSGLEDRISKLEAWQKETKDAMTKANQEVQSIKGLLAAVEKKVSVVSYDELSDHSGYVLSMSNGKKIILKHGAGVGVKADADGTLFWAIGDRFITTPDGQKVKAKGEDGAPGRTPLLKTDDEGNWLVSTDGGNKFEKVLTTDGKPIPAKVVEKEVLNLKIKRANGNIIVSYQGTEFVFKAGKLTLPIEYVAEYDVNADGTGFATDHANGSSGHFNWYVTNGVQDQKHNPSGKKLLSSAAFAGYHVPTLRELLIIIPSVTLDASDSPKVINDLQEHITVAGETKVYTADYDRTFKDGAFYGIRFKGQGDTYRSAYRFKRVENPEGGHIEAGQTAMMYEVMVRYLGPKNTGMKLEDIKKQEFWSDPQAKYIRRVFPAGGYTEPKDLSKRKSMGKGAWFWSSETHCDYNATTKNEFEECKAEDAYCYDYLAIGMVLAERHWDATLRGFQSREDGYAVRLFKDAIE